MSEPLRQETDKIESGYGVWTANACPLQIEYSHGLIEEIRHLVAEGFQKLSRGGMEVGGLLYGTREGTVMRITALRSMVCEHARGPGLLLSDADRQALTAQIG